MSKANHPNEIATRVGEHLKNGNLEGLIDLFHPGCQVYFPKGAPPAIGHEAILELFKPFVEVKPTLRSEITSEILNGNIALLEADWVIEGPDGSILDKGHSTEVAVQNPDGSWVYYIDCPFGSPAMER